LVSVDSDGTYPISPDTLLVPEGSNSITLVPDDPSWVCDCPTGCTYNIDVSADTQLNFFVTTTQNSWFQSIGGDLHANAALGQSIRNPVSVLCSGACEPYTTLLDDLGTSNSSGIVSYAGGTADFMSESGSQTFNIDEAGNDWLAQSLYRIPPTEDYAYFMRLFEMGLTPSEDFVTNPPTDASKPSGTPADGKAAFYRAGDLTINSSSWSVNSTESIVVFISGNLNIANNITVADGGFLAFIVQGNINFDSNLGSASPSNTVADVAGVYIASGTINTGSAGSGQDLKFVGEGIFVGWDGINLERDYRNDENNTAPAELFRYRPDFLFSAPDEFNRPLFHWQEVAP
jgi:hypothetical protein